MKALIIADSPLKNMIIQEKYDLVIALDGAANFISELNIKTNVVIGDLDAIDPKMIPSLIEYGVEVIKIENQNYSDMDKGIQYALSQGAKEIHITNALGGRIDHTLYNLRILRKYYSNQCRIKVLNNNEIAEFLKDQQVLLKGNIGDPVAIMALPKALVNSQGLQYELKDYTLDVGFNESSCNQLAFKSAQIKVVGEALIIYKNDIVFITGD